MAIKELLYNKLKWFNVADNADSVIANGKKYTAIPKQIEIPAGAFCVFLNDANEASGFHPEISQTTIFDCVGETNDGYFFTGRVTDGSAHSENLYYDAGGTTTFIGLVSKSQVTKVIWGGKLSLLSRLWRAFKPLSVKEVA